MIQGKWFSPGDDLTSVLPVRRAVLGFDSDAGCMGIIVQASPAVDTTRICDLNNISVLDPTDPIDPDPIHIGPVRTVEIPDQGSLRLQQ